MKASGPLLLLGVALLCAPAVCAVSSRETPAAAKTPQPVSKPSAVPLLAFGPPPKYAPFHPVPSLRQNARRARRTLPGEQVKISRDALGYNVFLSTDDSTELFNLNRGDFISLDRPYQAPASTADVASQASVDLVFLKERSTPPTFCWALAQSAPFTVTAANGKTLRIAANDGSVVIQTRLGVYRYDGSVTRARCP